MFSCHGNSMTTLIFQNSFPLKKSLASFFHVLFSVYTSKYEIHSIPCLNKKHQPHKICEKKFNFLFPRQHEKWNQFNTVEWLKNSWQWISIEAKATKKVFSWNYARKEFISMVIEETWNSFFFIISA